MSQRATQAECFDTPGRPLEEVRSDYQWLARVNRLTHFAKPFQHFLPYYLGSEGCRNLRILDVGAGDGRLGETLEAWARRNDWHWEVTNLDANPLCAHIAPRPVVLGSATQLPFPDDSFDVVVATTMTHHLTDAQTVDHFREAGRVARKLVLIVDVQRRAWFLGLMWLVLVLLRAPAHFRADGVLSILRGWRLPEWRELAAKAGLDGARFHALAGMLLVLAWRPPPPPPLPDPSQPVRGEPETRDTPVVPDVRAAGANTRRA